ncbi:MAG TPA: YsnF/AvaK domain-containing protein [Allosphingosinicella sp.]
MSRHVTALYDTRDEADAARQRLSSAVSLDQVRIIDKDNGGGSGGGSGSGGLGSLYMPHEDRQAYGEGIRRGGFLLCAEVETGEDADKIVRLLEESPGVDMEERQNSWRGEGWSPQAATGQGASTGAPLTASGGSTQAQGNLVSEERIPIVEEELRVGKREVERGGARVRTYVREVPVQEQVTLREEHVSVERRPVEGGQQAQAAAVAGRPEDLLQEREIDMRETAEEAVVQKVASVTEEVVVRKTAEEHVEQISDTVRRTEVDVQEGTTGTSGSTGGTDRSAFGSFTGGGQAGGTGSDANQFERDRTR